VKLICGLGNPGRQYRNHRHTIGFRVLEELCRRLDVALSQRRFEARLAQGRLGLERVVLLEPQSFMNLSGEPVAAAARFFKIAPEDTLVIHDELDLPFGRIQLKQQGGSGGHNGLNSIIERWGTSDFARLRFGIGRPSTDSSQEDVVEYVLSDFDPQEREQLPELIDKAASGSQIWAEKGLATAMNQFNRR
jgi:peptidyl-tRNA hydrolase, PTH1 family